MFCINCGAKNLDSSRFCKSCGENLSDVQDLVPQEKTRPEVSQKTKKIKKNRWVPIVSVSMLLVILIAGTVSLGFRRRWWSNGQLVKTQRLTDKTSSVAQSNDQKKDTAAAPAPVFTCGTSTVKDADGNSYNTVQVGTQCWMASNLKVGKKTKIAKDQTGNGKIEKWCYEDHDSSCDSDGGLYTWDEAMQYSIAEGAQGICPSGWHIPSDADQHALEDHLKDAGENCSSSRKGKACASTGTQLQSGGSSGLDFPLAGFCYQGKCSGQNSGANFWSSTQIDSQNAQDRLIYSDSPAVSRDASLKGNGFSVRCIKDE